MADLTRGSDWWWVHPHSIDFAKLTECKYDPLRADRRTGAVEAEVHVAVETV